MIPPISVSTGTFRYTLDALIVRSDDFHRTVVLLQEATTEIGVPGRTQFDPERAALWHDLNRLAREIADVRDDIDGVIATIDPGEALRSRIATGAPWPLLRPLSQWIVSHTPIEPTATHFEPMAVTKREAAVPAPRNLADRSKRIPTGDDQVRIDRFDSDGGTRFEVYIAGTDFSAGPENPWWAGSNVDFLRSGQSRSLSGTETALRDAGVTHETPLVITGHSQGGLIGVALASSGRFTVDAVFTIGTPLGVVADSHGVPMVHVAHPEDPVPALGGNARNANGTTWFVHPEPRVLGADAHLVENYRPSAEAIVQLDDPALRSLESRIHATTVGTATWFRATTSG
jgi:hypothetical protein